MTGQPLRLTTPGELPAPPVDSDSALVLTDALDALARLRTPYWIGDSGECTPWRASSPRHNASSHRPSATPETRSSPGRRSPNSSTSRPSTARRRAAPMTTDPLTRITRIMSEHLLNDLDVGSGGDRQRGRGVPERLRSETVETDPRGCLVEYCALEGARPHRSTRLLAAEHERVGALPATWAASSSMWHRGTGTSRRSWFFGSLGTTWPSTTTYVSTIDAASGPEPAVLHRRAEYLGEHSVDLANRCRRPLEREVRDPLLYVGVPDLRQLGLTPARNHMDVRMLRYRA